MYFVVTGAIIGENCDEIRYKCDIYNAKCTRGKCLCIDDHVTTLNNTYCYQS